MFKMLFTILMLQSIQDLRLQKARIHLLKYHSKLKQNLVIVIITTVIAITDWSILLITILIKVVDVILVMVEIVVILLVVTLIQFSHQVFIY